MRKTKDLLSNVLQACKEHKLDGMLADCFVALTNQDPSKSSVPVKGHFIVGVQEARPGVIQIAYRTRARDDVSESMKKMLAASDNPVAYSEYSTNWFPILFLAHLADGTIESFKGMTQHRKFLRPSMNFTHLCKKDDKETIATLTFSLLTERT